MQYSTQTAPHQANLFIGLRLCYNENTSQPDITSMTAVKAQNNLVEKHWPVAVTVKGPWLAQAAVLFVAAISAVELVVASLCHWVTHWPSRKMAGCQCPLSCQTTGKLVLAAALASFFILSSLRTVPFAITALLLGEATSCGSPTPTFPRGAVAPNMERGVKAASLGAKNCVVPQGQQASVRLNLDWFVIRGAGYLSTCRTKT